MTFNITIIGLDIVGSSIGLALGEFKEKVTRTGVDKDHDRAKKALKLGALDRIEHNLPTAVADADLILLCEPTAESIETLKTIAADLTDGKYLFDVGCSARLFNQELIQISPDFAHHVNLSLTVNPAHLNEITLNAEAARADFFKGGILFISSTKQSSTDAVELAETLASMLKTDLVFTEPVELDGLRTSTQQLPEILASALVHVVSDQSGWREARRMTDRGFFTATAPVYLTGTSDKPAKGFIANRDNLVVWIDLVLQELQRIRHLLIEGKEEDLNTWWKGGLEQLLKVQTHRQSGEWDFQSQPKVEIPSMGERFGRLVGLGKKKK